MKHTIKASRIYNICINTRHQPSSPDTYRYSYMYMALWLCQTGIFYCIPHKNKWFLNGIFVPYTHTHYTTIQAYNTTHRFYIFQHRFFRISVTDMPIYNRYPLHLWNWVGAQNYQKFVSKSK